MSSYKKYSELPESSNTTSSGSNGSRNDLLIPIESTDHKKSLVLNNKVVIVDVYGDWCAPCKAITPRFSELSKVYAQYGFIFAKEDVDKKITQNIRGVPSFQYFYNGEMVDTSTGADINDVKEKIEKLLVSFNNEKQRMPSHQQNSMTNAQFHNRNL